MASLVAVVLVWGAADPATGDGSTADPAPVEAREAEVVPTLLEILPPSPSDSGRHLRIETLITSPEIRRVEFRLDGRVVDEDRRFPFVGGLDAERCRAARRLEAIGFDRDGIELARDAVLLESTNDEFAISFDDVRPLEGRDWLEVTAVVRSPAGAVVERVDFYRGSHYSASVAIHPFRIRLPGSDETPFLRAVAHLADGRIVESVHLLAGGTDTLSVSLIEIYTMVSDRAGRPVTGLEPSMFELHHDGVPRAIERFSEGDEVPLSLALVIDSSGSMLESMERAKRAAHGFLTQVLDPGDEVLLVDFDHHPRLLEAATDEVDRLIDRFEEIESDGASAVYDGIAFALLQLEHLPGRRALVVLTDGRDSGSRLTPRECARLARRSGVPVFVLRPAHRFDDRPSHHALALDELADSTGGALYQIRSADDVVAAYEAIDRQLRGQYLLAFESESTLSPEELDALTVRVDDERLRVRTLLGGQVRLAD